MRSSLLILSYCMKKKGQLRRAKPSEIKAERELCGKRESVEMEESNGASRSSFYLVISHPGHMDLGFVSGRGVPFINRLILATL